MAVMPAMRAPPFRVCNWRCSSATRLLVLAIAIPGGERQSRPPRSARSPLRCRYWRSRDRTPRRRRHARRRRGGRLRRGRRRLPARRRPASGSRELRHDRRGAGLVGGVRELGIELRLELAQAREQRRLLGEERGRFVDVRHDVVDGAHRIRQRSPAPASDKPAAAVEHLAHE